jgi:acetoin utilization protein AcuB
MKPTPKPSPSTQRVAAWMHAPVHVVRPHDPIDHARALCERHRVNQLPVVADGELVGIVTDRDLRDAFPSVMAEAADPVEAHRITAILPVEEIMTRGVVTVGESDGIEVAASIMRRERIGALPVVRDGRLVGIVTRSDLLDALLSFTRAEPVQAAS